MGSGLITICYTKEWIKKSETKKFEMRKVAFHEVCEALLWKMQELIKGRFISEKDIPNASNRVIRRLENVFHKKHLNKDI